MTEMLYYGTGAVAGALTLLPFAKSTAQTLADIGFLSLVAMLMIYVGAQLVSSDLTRILIETGFSLVVLGAAAFFRLRWPVGIGVLVLCHAIYDFLLGHASGVADWYPPMCVGFDVVVGTGLVYLLVRRRLPIK